VRGVLLVNPRAGSAQAAEQLYAEAMRLGIGAHVLEPGEDAAELARGVGVGAIGIAGGDGSLAQVAAVAVERGVPFVCIPLGTHNHFARDVGLDRDDPIGALEAFGGVERRVDVGRVNGRLFLNNVSLGAYAALVDEEQRAGRLRALLRATRRRRLELEIDGSQVSARIVVVGNNAYKLEPLALGVRERLDEAVLHLGIARDWLPRTWVDRRAARVRIAAPVPRLSAAIDGEPVALETPLDFEVEPEALRLLLPGV
jgi:diacylglycerol kinase family enzyme